jgi:signal transduction histidine kinase/DNA-binding response OmpR family regulator
LLEVNRPLLLEFIPTNDRLFSVGKVDMHQDVILVVDDTPTNLQILFSCLETAGYKVLLAQNGEHALSIVANHPPDLILLDILMPGIDGFTVSLRLKAQITTRDIPIIFLTALAETTDKIKGFEVGGVDYITKPIEQREVLIRIQTHLSLQKMRQRLITQNQRLQQEIENRLEISRQLQQRTSELELKLQHEALVKQIRKKIRDSLDENQILQTVTEELAKLLQVDNCHLELYDFKKISATIVHEYTNGLLEFKDIYKQLEDDEELYRQLLQKNIVQLVRKIESRENTAYFTGLACPIFENPGGKESILGNIWLFRPPERVFSDFEINLVKQVASQCAIAIRQARLYEAAQKQVEELAKINRLKDDFLKTISHELRSPMSSIQLSVQTLDKLLEKEHKQKSPLFNKVLAIFREACQRQKQLVDDLLSLCYVDAKAELIVAESIDLLLWLPEIIQHFNEQTQAQQQKLVIDLPQELPILKSDLSTLDRILKELLNNACKYTPAGETISLKAIATAKTIVLIVSNSGVEIPAEERERIFTQFYRIPNNDPWQYGGTGLGLTLVQKLAESIDAFIEVESSHNLTSFVLKCPLELT